MNVRSNSDNYNDPNIPQKSASQNTAFFDQFRSQNTKTLPFSLFNRNQENIQMYIPFTDYISQFQNDATVTNQSQSNRSNESTFMLET